MIAQYQAEQATQVIAEIVPLLTSCGQTTDKLKQVAKHLSVRRVFESVDFIVIEGPGLNLLRHHQYACMPGEVAAAWEQSVQVKDAFSSFALFEVNRTAINYEHVQTDLRLNTNERQMAALAELGSVLVVPLVWDDEVRGAMVVTSRLEYAFDASDQAFLVSVARQVSALLRQEALIEDLREANSSISRMQDDTVMMLAGMAEAYDDTTGIHLLGVRQLTELLAAELGLSDKECVALGKASVLHDLGKVRLSRDILAKPGALDDEERKTMQTHPAWGEAILAGHPGFELAARVARWHHERWDGAGYPDHLRGAEIPLDVSIVSVADAFDTMIRARPYKGCICREWAIAEVLMSAGSQFNPRVAEALAHIEARGDVSKANEFMAAAA